MKNIDGLQKILYDKFHRRPPGIDKLDRLWEAAVLIPLVETPAGISILFEERAHGLRRQPGEICFPGGKVECGDGGFAHTAVRETCEELGIKSEQIVLCGELDALVTHAGPIIHPFVGVLKASGEFSFNKSEVERVFTVPLEKLLQQTPQRYSMYLADRAGKDFPFELAPSRSREWRRHKEYYVYFYRWEGEVIWGLTARMLYAFLRRSDDVLRDFFEKE